MERVAELADLERGARAVEVPPPEVRLAEGEVDEDPAGLEDAVGESVSSDGRRWGLCGGRRTAAPHRLRGCSSARLLLGDPGEVVRG